MQQTVDNNPISEIKLFRMLTSEEIHTINIQK
jgi:hypothetical protein